MKNKFRLLMSAALAASLLFAGCAKDNGEGPDPDPTGGEVSRMVLTVQSLAEKTPGSRAATTGDEGQQADPNELTIYPAHGLKVAIFYESGLFAQAKEYALELKEGSAGTEEAVYSTPTSDAITLAEGSYYFFVFANDAADKIALPTAGASMSEWMADEFAVDYTAQGVPDIVDLDAVPSKGFLLGTLWKEDVKAIAKTTSQEPQEVTLPTLGRLSSKIWVKQLKATTSTTNPALSGTFSSAMYRLGAVALEMSNVGIVQTAGKNKPFDKGTIVTSYLHMAGHDSNKFRDKAGSTWKAVSATVEPTANGFFYASENTTGRTDNNDKNILASQFYGNTTHVILELVYTPVSSEILMWNGSAWVTGGVLEETTFWSAGEGENRKIYNENPKSNDDKLAATGFAEGDIHEYSQGKSFYVFPVNDPNEDDPIAKNRVLRNHYYEYTIDGIRDLGAPTETEVVDDDKPVEENTNLVLKISVGKWDKVKVGQIIL